MQMNTERENRAFVISQVYHDKSAQQTTNWHSHLAPKPCDIERMPDRASTIAEVASYVESKSQISLRDVGCGRPQVIIFGTSLLSQARKKEKREKESKEIKTKKEKGREKWKNKARSKEKKD